MKYITRSIAPAMLTMLFAYAVVSKLADVTGFRHEMHNQPFPPEIAEAFVWLIPAVEVAAIILLLNEKWQRYGLALSTALMGLFTGYVALVLAGFWRDVPCSCGGVLQNMSWSTHLLFNLFFLTVSVAGMLVDSKKPLKHTPRQTSPSKTQ